MWRVNEGIDLVFESREKGGYYFLVKYREVLGRGDNRDEEKGIIFRVIFEVEFII